MGNKTTKIENARFIVTLDNGRRIIENGSIVIEDDRIESIGKSTDLKEIPADEVIDASEMIVTPGFCNGHMHISYAHATRGIFPDDLGPSYLPYVFKLQGMMTEEEEYYTTLLGLTELLKYGTTCFLDPGSTKYLDICMEAYEKAGCRVIVGSHVTDLPNPLNLPVYPTDKALDIIGQTISKFDGRSEGRVRAWAMPFSSDYATDTLLTGSKEIADHYDVGMTLHQSHSSQAVQLYREEFGKSPIERLDSLNVLDTNVLLSHVINTSDTDVEIIARTGTKAVVCPPQSLKQGTEIINSGKVPEMLARGVPVGLGTDAPNNSNLVEVLRAIYLIAIMYKGARQDVSKIPPETAIEMGTITGAKALGLDKEIGSVEVGKKADLVLFDTKRVEWRTLFNPVNNLVYNADGRSVHTVIVDGRILVRNHVPTFVNEWDLIQKVQGIGEKLLHRSGIQFPSIWPVS